FDGGKAAVEGVAAGKAEVMLAPLIAAVPLLREHRLRGLAVSGLHGVFAVPDLPTVDAVLPGFTAAIWFGVLAPAATPNAVIEQLSADLDSIVHEPAVVAQFSAIGVEPVGGSPAIFGDLIRAEVARWRRVAKEAGARIN